MPAILLSSLWFPHNSLSMQTHLLFWQFSILFKKLFSSFDDPRAEAFGDCSYFSFWMHFSGLKQRKKNHLLTLSGRIILYLIGSFPAYMTPFSALLFYVHFVLKDDWNFTQYYKSHLMSSKTETNCWIQNSVEEKQTNNIKLMLE